MDLKIKDICELLKQPEKTILSWIKDSKIPAYKINGVYHFNKAEINDWMIKHNIAASEKALEVSKSGKHVSISSLLKKGGIFYNIRGDKSHDVIAGAINVIPMSSNLDKDKVLKSLLEREKLMPTAIGKGIAIPHPRNPIIDDIENESLSICILEKEIDYGALDEVKVHSLFIILSATPARHLETLSKISFLCQQENFISMLKTKSPHDKILSFIQEKENEIIQRQK